jgi:hypothetical protein
MHLKSYQIYDSTDVDNISMPNRGGMIQKMTIDINQQLTLSSDLYFRIKHKGSFKNKLICRFGINPSFIKEKYLFWRVIFSVVLLHLAEIW